MITTHEQGNRSNATGQSTYWQAWFPQDAASAAIVVVHGIHEHSARYAHVGDRLATAGFAVYAADHRGHGRSSGRRANIERMALIQEDLRSFVRFAAERHPGLPVFMVGHSLGGLIALLYACGAPESGSTALDGLVVSGPAVTATAGSALARRLAGVLSALVPNLGVAALDADYKISRDPEVVRAYRDDPLVYHGRIKARTGAEILAAMQQLPAKLPGLSVPLLLLHGTDDQICPPAGSVLVHGAVSSPDRTLRRYPGLYHEVFNEPEREAILTDLISWLNDRSGRR
ncbi:MAG: lysophospholipase [Pseudonocardiaceae bacterium]